MAYKLTVNYRTKSEAKDAVKRGDDVKLMRQDGTVLDSANGHAFPITGKLDHYKEWSGTAKVWGGKIELIR